MGIEPRVLPTRLSSAVLEDGVASQYIAGYPARLARVLVVADAQGTLYAAAQMLPRTGRPVSTVFEEGHVVANVLAHAGEHNLLLVRGLMTSAFCLPRLIDRLRQLEYRGCITYCARELTKEIAAAYEAISVDRCLQAPVVCTTLVQVVEWLQSTGAPSGPGLSVFEV